MIKGKVCHLDVLWGLPWHESASLLLVERLQLWHVEQSSQKGQATSRDQGLFHPGVQIKGLLQLQACTPQLRFSL